ncbi:MAG: type II toxin-antitoxin system HicB family antitoxin [Chloroflexi bacterium]|nr:type II toxin-antitoxin system HicB family antitoxin [Chloroflexota bacterium]
MKYLAIIEKTDNGYSAYLPDLPGCIAAGDTREETEQLIREGVVYHLEFMREDGDPIPEPTTTALTVEVELPAVASVSA